MAKINTVRLCFSETNARFVTCRVRTTLNLSISKFAQKSMNVSKYDELIQAAIRAFWSTRSNQASKQREGEGSTDRGARSEVTGGKQLEGFLQLIKQVAMDVGIPEECIYLKGNELPGYFRATKSWDVIIMTPSKKLIAVIELKSQVGSFGNNINNRTEEALGSARDFWIAYREKAFSVQSQPWLGYFILVEKNEKSSSPVKSNEPHFPIFDTFRGASYLERYKILCERLMLERDYAQCCLIWSNKNCEFGSVDDAFSIHAFLQAMIGCFQANIEEFK